jgi:hypothetical protein
VPADLPVLLRMVSAVVDGTPETSQPEVLDRYLSILLDALRPPPPLG